MSSGKQRGRNNYQIYTPDMNEKGARRLLLETKLRSALDNDQFFLQYQPKATLSDGSLCGFEALLRWRSPEHGVVSPGEFIPILEDTGLIGGVGKWIIRTVCAQLKSWGTDGLVLRPVAINLSMRQLQQDDFDVEVRQIFDEFSMDSAMVDFEITESMLMGDPEHAVQVIKKLKGLNVRIAVDDFGTGYSSLAYLKRFPLDALKIDQSFVRDVTTDPNNAAIILAIITLAHSLKLKVIAEGVETEAQLMFLKTHGCDEMQGYYFARPLNLDDCTKAIAENRHLSITQHFPEIPQILLVDDNKADLEIIRRALEPIGYRMMVADDPRVALEILMQHHVDIVISDHSMPHMSGIDLMASVRTLYPNTLRIVMSGVADVAAVTDAVNLAGIHRYLSKDWNATRLQTEVLNAYQLHQPSRVTT